MTLADRLQDLLDDRGCSVSEAARLAGMTRQQVRRLLNGSDPNPDYLTLLKIVEAIGATLGELFADEGEDESLFRGRV